MMTYVRYLSRAGRAYDKLKDALADVEEKAYTRDLFRRDLEEF